MVAIHSHFHRHLNECFRFGFFPSFYWFLQCVSACTVHSDTLQLFMVSDGRTFFPCYQYPLFIRFYLMLLLFLLFHA